MTKYFLLLCSLAVGIMARSQNTTDVLIVNTSTFTVSENSVFISPLNNTDVLNSNNRMISLTNSDVDAFISTNSGGTGWTNRGVLSNSLADPAVVIDRSGYYYISFIKDVSNSIDRLLITQSTDGGVNWGSNVTISGSDIADKGHLWVDNKLYKNSDGTSNSYAGRLYAAYTKSESPGTTRNIKAAYSSNQAASWLPSTLPVISTMTTSVNQHLGVNLQTGPNGEVYACWGLQVPDDGSELFEKYLGFNKSVDGGATWGTAYKIFGSTAISGSKTLLSGLGGNKSMRSPSFPSMTVNQQNGYIFIVWANYSAGASCSFPTNCETDLNIYMIRSTDGGNTWTSAANAIRVNQDNTNEDQWFPWIACDEASGALICVYYDSRDFGGNDQANTYVSISYDQGDTWSDTKISDAPWAADYPTGFGGYAGDYIGLDVYHNKAVAIWSDDRTGTLLAYANPFEVPCPTDLGLTYGNYYVTDETSSFTYDAAYSTSSTINVSGSPSSYKIYSGANVLMTAATSITLNDGFECNGEFTADISSCPGGDFSQRANGNEPSNEVNTQSPSPFDLVKNNFPVRVYPNPSSNGKLQSYIPLVTSDEADTHNPKPAYIFVYNSMGEMVYSKQATDWISELDLSGQPAGFYLMKVTKGDKIYNGKIILK